jgi:hypothetical protein
MMAEVGGSTTQSGIYYQNTIAALYLGRMLDPRISDLTQQVTSVRSEAREYVDDIVVMYADSHRRFIQVKESIGHTSTNKKWLKLWEDFEKQCWDAEFKNEDRLVIFLGKLDDWFTNLNTLCERARGAKDLDEWQDILQNRVLGKLEMEVLQLLTPEHQNLADSLRLFSVVEVEQKPLDILESFVPAWMPANNQGEQVLFSTLRDLCGKNARTKIEMDESALRAHLKNTHNIEIFPPPSSSENNLITGSVLFEDGRPVENACVRVIGLDLVAVTTGPDGYFEFVVDDQSSWIVQVSYKDMSMNRTCEKVDIGQTIIIKFPLLACFSIDSPLEREEIPLGEQQGRILEGSFPILSAHPDLAETAKVDVEVLRFPEGNAIKQNGTDQISIYQGKWYYVKAKFTGEGVYDVIAKARIGKNEDFRKVRVNCIDKGKYYKRTIEEDQKIRGVKVFRSIEPEVKNLNDLKSNLYEKQNEFFDYYPGDIPHATLIIRETLEILDQILPKFPDDLWLQNVRAYTFKNYAMVMRDSHNDDEFLRGLSEAEKMFKAVRDQDPGDAGAWNGLGSIATLRGKYKEALDYIEKALEINPNYEEALKDKETVLKNMKK